MGFTIIQKTTTFSPVKTNLADARVKSKEGMPTYSAASGEADAYTSGCEMLSAAGVPIAPANDVVMAGVRIALGARVVIDPTFGVGVAAWRQKLPSPQAVRLSNRSTLLLQGELRGLRIESLDLDGALVLRMCEGANVTLRNVRVANSGWSFKSLWGKRARGGAGNPRVSARKECAARVGLRPPRRLRRRRPGRRVVRRGVKSRPDAAFPRMPRLRHATRSRVARHSVLSAAQRVSLWTGRDSGYGRAQNTGRPAQMTVLDVVSQSWCTRC